MRHQDVQPGFIHTPFNWVFADAAARTAATGLAAGDVEKVALQLSDATMWLLSAVGAGGAPTWVELAGSGGGSVPTLDQVPAAVGPVDLNAQRLTNIGDASDETDALSLVVGDGRYVPQSELGVDSGVATLGADGILTEAQRPAGGGGSGTLAGDTDVAIVSPADAQVLTFDGASSKWMNKAASAGGGAPTLAQIAAVWQWPVVVCAAPLGGSADDTANINAAISAATQAAINGNGVAEVWFHAGVYTVNGALIQNGAQSFGGTTKGNAQIPLPNIPSTTPKVTLVLRFAEGAPVWDGARLLTSGTTFVSNLTGAGNVFATYGSPSVFGGPTQQQLTTAANSNLILVTKGGWNVIVPANKAVYGIDLQNVAMHNLEDIGLNASVNPASPPTAVPTAGGAGIRTAGNWSESQSNIRRVTSMGFSYGIVMGTNSVIHDAYVVYAQYGVAPWKAQARAMRIDNLITDSCQYHLSSTLSSSAPVRIDIGSWVVEDGGSAFAGAAHVHDPNNQLRGEAKFHNTKVLTAGPTIMGGAGYSVENLGVASGAYAAPAVPASGTPLTNTSGRKAAINVGGDGLTGVSVDGEAQSVVPGTYVVPNNKAITLTYTGAVQWSWVLL